MLVLVTVVFVHVALLTADLPHWAVHASQASLTAFAVMLTTVVVFWLRGERFFDATIGRWLPDHARGKALGILRSARSGLEILPDRRLVAVEGSGNAGEARIWLKSGGVPSGRGAFNAAVKPLPGFESAPAFEF